MISLRSIGCFIILLGLIGCASSTQKSETIETIDYRSDMVSSPNLSLTVPSGWREINDNKNRFFDIWLVNGDNNASICFIPIHLDNRYSDKSDEDKHKLAVELLLSKKRSTAQEFEIILKKEDFRRYNFTTIRYITDSNLQSSIIFGKGNLYYECLAYSDVNSNLSELDLEAIFKVQDEIVITSEIK